MEGSVMAIKIISGGKIPEPQNNGLKVLRGGKVDQSPKQIQRQSEQPEQQSFGSRALEAATGLGKKFLSGLESAINLPETIASAVAQPIGDLVAGYATGNLNIGKEIRAGMPEEKTSTEQFFERNFPKEYGNPRSIPEKIAQEWASDLPLAFLGGGSLASKALRTGTSAAARVSAKELGFGPKAQSVAGILGGSIPDLAKKGILPGQFRKMAESKMTSDYAKARPISKQIDVSGDKFKSSIKEEIDKVHSGASGLEKDLTKTVSHELRKAENIIDSTGKVNIYKAWEQKKHLNKLARNASNDVMRDYYTRATGIINDTLIQKAAKEHPEFGKYFNAAEDLFIGLNAPSKLRKVFEKSADLQSILNKPEAKVALLGAGSFVGLKKAAITAAGVYTGRTLTRAYDLITKSKEARRLAKEIYKDVINDNRASLLSNAQKFNNLA